jgi:hypothetical protein
MSPHRIYVLNNSLGFITWDKVTYSSFVLRTLLRLVRQSRTRKRHECRGSIISWVNIIKFSESWYHSLRPSNRRSTLRWRIDTRSQTECLTGEVQSALLCQSWWVCYDFFLRFFLRFFLQFFLWFFYDFWSITWSIIVYCCYTLFHCGKTYDAQLLVCWWFVVCYLKITETSVKFKNFCVYPVKKFSIILDM